PVVRTLSVLLRPDLFSAVEVHIAELHWNDSLSLLDEQSKRLRKLDLARLIEELRSNGLRVGVDNATGEGDDATDAEDDVSVADENEQPVKKRIAEMRMIDAEIGVISRQYTRRCGVCFSENPSQRAAYNICGHILCLPCAEEISSTKKGKDR
ncbi:hypothetical protein PFISCL1PPCAC_7555, partial [Pristionchus fissidentatus]